MTVTAPPRPPRPSDPVDREEVKALVEALIEEARKRTASSPADHRAVVRSSTLVGVALLAVVDAARVAQTASPPLAAPSSPGRAGAVEDRVCGRCAQAQSERALSCRRSSTS